MFDNKFNSKKVDPLVEAAKGAMMEGELRRQAIAAVNEEFGVYNRNAVIREHLAAYDARIEEAYKCMKEGKPLSPKQQKMAAIAGDPKKIDAADLASLRKGAKIDEKKGCYEEEQIDELKKPTAKTAMKAYYRAYDSDVQSGEGERSNRLGNWKQKHLPGKSARNQKDTGKAELDDYDRKVVKKGGTLTKASQKDTKAEIKSRLGKHTKPKNLPEESLDELKKPTAKTAMKAYYRAYDSDVQSGEGERSNRLYKWKQKHLPGKSARNQKDTGKADLPDVGNIEFHKAGYSGHVTKKGKLSKAASRDTKDGIKSRLGKHTKPHLPEESLDEATRKHFAAHAADIAKISDQGERNKAASSAADTYARLNKRFDHAKFHKAAGSTAHEAPKSVKESVLAAIRAKYMKEDNLEELSAFGKEFAAARKAGQSQFMSKVTGKMTTTAMKGEPSAPKPAKTMGPPMPAASKDVGDAGYKSGQTVSLKPMSDTGSAQAAEPPKTAPTPPAAQPKGVKPPEEIATREKQAATAAAGAPTPPSRPVDLGGSKPAPAPAQQPGAPADDASAGVKKLMSMNESVQVGANRYRIV
jgi:hypothetical protein